MTVEFSRCFLALKPDAATTRQLLQVPRIGRSRPVLSSDVHLTLAFVGHMSSEQVAEVGERLAELRPQSLSALAPQGLALWPTPQRARVVVAVYELSNEMADLHARTMAMLQSMALSVEMRRYRPHITVARLPRTLRVLPPHALDNVAVELPQARFTRLGLYGRAPVDEEARYQPLHEIDLN